MGILDTKRYKKGARNGLCPKTLAGEPHLCRQRYKEVQFTEACSSLVADNSQSIGEPCSLHATTSRVPSSATNIENTHAAVKCCLTNQSGQATLTNTVNCIQLCRSSNGICVQQNNKKI